MPKVVPEYKEEAKNRILEAAYNVFAEKGYRQATMDDVASKLGVSKGSLYLYYESKEELFEAIARTAPRALKEILYSSFNQKMNPVQSASEFFDKMLKRYGSNSGLSFEIVSEATRNPVVRRVLRENHDEYTKILMGFFQEMRRKKLVGEDLDLRALSHALIALWNGLETSVVSGLPIGEVKRAWLEAMKAMFRYQHA